jgi:hypothetical protein
LQPSSPKKSRAARYNFILGQLYEDLEKQIVRGTADQVIKMNRNRIGNMLSSLNLERSIVRLSKGDTLEFVKDSKKLLADRENRPFLGL